MKKTDDMLNAIDVEFLIENDGQFMPAGLFLPFQGMIGTDNQGHGAGMRHTAEIRTRPLPNVKHIVSDMGCAVRAFANRIRPLAPEMIFLTGHFHHQNSIGGHVHFSSLCFDDWDTTCRGIQLLHKLSTLFAKRYDDPEQIELRRGRGYFVPNWEDSIRVKTPMLGVDNFHWEFRQWGSFLVSPVYAYATIAFSKAVLVATHEKLDTAALWKLSKAKEWDAGKVIAAVHQLRLPNPDLDDLPEALELLEVTRAEMKERWSADFLDMW